jgi:hypothetical protein
MHNIDRLDAEVRKSQLLPPLPPVDVFIAARQENDREIEEHALHLSPPSHHHRFSSRALLCLSDSDTSRPLRCSRMQVSFPFPNSNGANLASRRLHVDEPMAAKSQVLRSKPQATPFSTRRAHDSPSFRRQWCWRSRTRTSR